MTVLPRYFGILSRAGSILLIALLQCVAPMRAKAYDFESLKAMFSERTLDPVEGIWQWPDDGAIIAVTRNSATTFAMVVIESPTLSLKDEVQFGSLAVTPEPGTFKAMIHTAVNKRGALTKPHEFVLKISNKGNMSLHQYNSNVRVSFWRWIPYLFRLTLVRPDRVADGLDGPLKIFPRVDGAHLPSPVLL